MAVLLSPVQEWLTSLPGLPQESVRRAATLFEAHRIDVDFLDFLISGEGSCVLTAWRDRLEPPAAAPARKQSGLEQQKESPKQGRQRIPAADRQVGHHYFHPSNRSSGIDAATQTPLAQPAKRRPAAPAQGALKLLNVEKGGPSKVPAGAANRLAAVAGRCEATLNQEQLQAPSSGWAAAAMEEAAKAAARPSKVRVGSGAGPRQEGKQQQDCGVEKTTASLQEAAGPRCQGALKNFNAEKGYGFIASVSVEGDIFVHRSELPEGEPQAGRALEFELIYREQKAQAKNVVWATGKRFVGCVKSLGEDYGFIACEEAHKMFGRDVYFIRSQFPVHHDGLKKLSFALLVNKGHPQASEIVCEDTDDSEPDVAPLDAASAEAEALPKRIVRW